MCNVHVDGKAVYRGYREVLILREPCHALVTDVGFVLVRGGFSEALYVGKHDPGP